MKRYNLLHMVLMGSFISASVTVFAEDSGTHSSEKQANPLADTNLNKNVVDFICTTEQAMVWKNGSFLNTPKWVLNAKDTSFRTLGDGTGILRMVTHNDDGMGGSRFKIVQLPNHDNRNHLVALPQDPIKGYADQSELRINVGNTKENPTFMFLDDTTQTFYAGKCKAPILENIKPN